ncbi:MAG: EamA family transporter, partial [Coriobacteriia bacterium]|nr:EamA family transporter [Coriobacteriia bacterium]
MVTFNPLHWSHKAKLITAFATLYVVWSTTYLAIRIGLQAGLPPALFMAMRSLPAGLLMLAFAKWRGRSLQVPKRDMRTIVVVGIFLLVGGQYGTFLAEERIPSGLAALIVALLPVWIATAESVVPGMDRPTWKGYLGLMVGFGGLGVLLWPRLTGVSGGHFELIGVGIQVLATWLWTAGSIISKGRPVKTDALVATGYEMLAAGLVCLVIGTLLGEWSGFTLTVPGAGALLYLIIMGSCVAFTAFVWAMRNAPASKVMTYAYVNPVIATFLGAVVLSEPVDVWVIAGMAIIVAGVIL